MASQRDKEISSLQKIILRLTLVSPVGISLSLLIFSRILRVVLDLMICGPSFAIVSSVILLGFSFASSIKTTIGDKNDVMVKICCL